MYKPQLPCLNTHFLFDFLLNQCKIFNGHAPFSKEIQWVSSLVDKNSYGRKGNLNHGDESNGYFHNKVSRSCTHKLLLQSLEGELIREADPLCLFMFSLRSFFFWG